MVLLALAVASPAPGAQATAQPEIQATLAGAQQLFYTGLYEEAAAMAGAVRTARPDDLAAYELLTSALHFVIKRAIGDAPNRRQALEACARCPELMAAFAADLAAGQALAKARLAKDPHDETALFFLGKLDLSHLWLHLGTLGRRTGWHEYWEARRALDAVIKRHPDHVRARVARAWMEYIVATRMPRGTKWLLGGGDRRRAMRMAEEAAAMPAEFFAHAEAVFALWEMQVRERRTAQAVATARELARDFPANRDLKKFLEAQQ